MAELVDALDSKSCAAKRAGSSPARGTNKKVDFPGRLFCWHPVLPPWSTLRPGTHFFDYLAEFIAR